MPKHRSEDYKITAVQYYLENNTELSFDAGEKEIEKLKLKIKGQIEEIQKCNFVPKPGMLCKYCDFNGICEFRSV